MPKAAASKPAQSATKPPKRPPATASGGPSASQRSSGTADIASGLAMVLVELLASLDLIASMPMAALGAVSAPSSCLQGRKILCTLICDFMNLSENRGETP